MAHFEAILCEQSIAAGTKVTMRIANELQGTVGNTQCEVNQGVGDVDRISAGIGAGQVVESAEGDLAVECKVIEAVQLDIANISADLERVPGSCVGKIINPLESIGGGTVGLINTPSKIAHRRTSANESSRECELWNVAETQWGVRCPPGIEPVIGALGPRLGDERNIRPVKTKPGFIKGAGTNYASVGERDQMVSAVLIHAITGNVGSSLSWGEREEGVNPGPAVAGGERVSTAEMVIHFNQKLIRPVGLIGRGDEVARRVAQVWLGK